MVIMVIINKNININKVQTSTHCLSPLLPLLTLLSKGLIFDLVAIISHFCSFKKALFKNSFVLRDLYDRNNDNDDDNDRIMI